MGNKAPKEKKRDRSLVIEAKEGATITCQKLDNDEVAAKKRAQSNKPRRGKTEKDVGQEDVQHMPMFNIKKFVEEKGEIVKERQNTPGSKARRQMLENKWQSDDTFASLVKPLQVEKDQTGMIKPKRFEAASESTSPPRKKYTVAVISKNSSALPTINNNSPDIKQIEQEILQEDSEDENDVEKLIEKELKNDSYNITVNGKKGSPASGSKRQSKRFKQYGSYEEGDTPSRNAINVRVQQPNTQFNVPSTINVALSSQDLKLPPIMSHSISKEQFKAQDDHLEESGVLRDYQTKFEHNYNGTQVTDSNQENSLGLNGLGSSYLSPQRFMSPGQLNVNQSALSNFSMKPQFNNQSQTVNASPSGMKHLRYSSQDMSQTLNYANMHNNISSTQRDDGKQTFDLYNKNQHLRQPQKFYSSAMVTGEQQINQNNQVYEERGRDQNQSKVLAQNIHLEARQSPTKVQLQERLKQQKQQFKHRDSDVTKLIKEIEARDFKK